VLAFTPRAAAREVEKILASAVANAEANHGLIGDDLIVSAAYVDEGPVIKRWRARARGRVARIQKKTCHVTIRLTPAEADGAAARRPRTTEDTAVEPEAQPAEEPKAEEKPKPKRASRAKKPAAPKAEAAAEKPKPKRAPRKKKTEGEES
jgi:large subunit ribosomal protein L22